ncbi:sugar phosphate isomerase/epimerase [Kribbella aluminosa]|uniref:Sugar phosphate isomerase/epimerase n=1 Tax=Kribbella aluminosa TaxID=416017 RepID=A0ABS4UWB1_9ACTN|nr:sugar phosphate isomerase/epimerase [Kribbella aluminosa]MBP2355948.1 sugar phosphate isomerase/epimerase [Kribbella aluminosa]
MREAAQQDLLATLQRLADLGFTKVEPFDFTNFEKLGDALQATGLAAPTSHAHFLGDDVDRRAVFEAARELGIETVIDPATAPERWQSAAGVAEIADELNAAAELGAGFGIRVGYHNHAYELESVIDGQTAFELLATRLAPEVVLEVDTYWAAVGGRHPVELLRRLGGRVTALHLKDGPGTKDTLDQVALGSGSMPLRAIIEAAPAALRVIELDDSRRDRFEAIASSYKYLLEEDLA